MFQKLLRVLMLLVLSVGLSASAYAPIKLTEPKNTQWRASHWIVMKNEDSKAGCSATAVDEHVLLTAKHCDLPNADLFLDGSPTPIQVSDKIFDGRDHMLLVMPGAHFTAHIVLDMDKYAAPMQGEGVYMWGNPDGVNNQYRIGYVTGTVVMPEDEIAPGQPIWILDLNVEHGDSGSAIYSANDGRLVLVTTYSISFRGGSRFAGAYALHFTQEQVLKAIDEGRGKKEF
jgi:hypothetical protein